MASRRHSPFAPLAASARVSNLATVWSPALVGAALATGVGTRAEPFRILLAAAVLSMLYAAGMLLNDLFDAGADAGSGKPRPIPQGLLTRRLAGSAAGLLICAALAIALASSETAAVFAGLLLLCIVLYNWLHKQTAAAVVFMAGCRVLVYPLAAAIIIAAGSWSDAPADAGPVHSPWPAGIAIGLYTLLLTLAARREDERTAGVARPLAFALPLPVILVPLLYSPRPTVWVGAAAGAFSAIALVAALHAARGRVRHAVHAWLAAFCLADAYILACLDQPALAGAAALCWLLTLVAHRAIPGT